MSSEMEDQALFAQPSDAQRHPIHPCTAQLQEPGRPSVLKTQQARTPSSQTLRIHCKPGVPVATRCVLLNAHSSVGIITATCHLHCRPWIRGKAELQGLAVKEPGWHLLTVLTKPKGPSAAIASLGLHVKLLHLAPENNEQRGNLNLAEGDTASV